MTRLEYVAAAVALALFAFGAVVLSRTPPVDAGTTLAIGWGLMVAALILVVGVFANDGEVGER